MTSYLRMALKPATMPVRKNDRVSGARRCYSVNARSELLTSARKSHADLLKKPLHHGLLMPFEHFFSGNFDLSNLVHVRRRNLIA